MKKFAIVLIAISSLLVGCVAYEVPNRDGAMHHENRDRDHDRDGVNDRGDRDRNGDSDRQDRRPNDTRRY
jgi:hypothetical protein